MTNIRSFLFIPGDSEKKLAKLDDCDADAVIMDLEDAVAPARKALAREMVAAILAGQPNDRRTRLWVRINPLDSGMALGDLAAVGPYRPDGILLPKAAGPAETLRLSHYLDMIEQQFAIAPGTIKVMPVATETPAAVFSLGGYAEAKLERLLGLTWGAEDLSASIGASGNVDATGRWTQTYQLARSLCLLAAHAVDVQAVETLYVDFRDDAGLRASCATARAEGFTGRIAIHPAQVQAINECFSPTQAEIDHAHRVLAAFDAEPDAGTVSLDGRMLDIPHLKQARRVIAQAASHPRSQGEP